MIPLVEVSLRFMSEEMLLLLAALIFVALLLTKVGSKFGVPALLLFLVLGMLVGPDGLGLKLSNYEIPEFLGHAAMTVILLSGGMSTNYEEIRPIRKQAISLATLGVLLTTLLTGTFIYFVVSPMLGAVASAFLGCLMIAAIMGSTDSASVFAVLKEKKMQLKWNLTPMLELESGSNDPMAYVLTIVLVRLITMLRDGNFNLSPMAVVPFVLAVLAFQIFVGYLVGLAVGHGGKWLLKRINLQSSALYSIMLLCFGFFANGITSLMNGNGLLAIYTTAVIIGSDKKLPYKREIRIHLDGITYLVQLGMFLMLGIMARPSQMPHILLPAVLIAFFMFFIGRPASIFLSLLPFRKMPFRAKLFTSWVGLRGAGPILFALTPFLYGLEGSEDVLNIVFIVTLLSLLVQGTTLTSFAKLLKLNDIDIEDVDTFGVDIPEDMGMLRNHTVTEEELVAGKTLRDLHLPHGIRVVMVRRNGRYISPHGSFEMQAGDELLILIGETED